MRFSFKNIEREREREKDVGHIANKFSFIYEKKNSNPSHIFYSHNKKKQEFLLQLHSTMYV